MAYNLCTPQNVYGPYQHTLFLGMSVQDFTATAGWNEQYSTLTVNLVEDNCSGTRQYFDEDFVWTSGSMAADPGFNNAQVGSAAFFKIADFEFAGLIQSYNLQDSPDGRNILTVNLISPGVILEGAQVIMNGYQGNVKGIPNIINAFGFLESLGADCPLIGGFGSPAGGFGNARVSDRGIPWVYLKQAMQVLLGGLFIPATEDYSQGVLKFRAGVGTYGSIASFDYVVDIDDLPTVTTEDYRIPGDGASVLEIISNVCRDGGYDFYVDLLPTRTQGVGAPIVNVIKIRTVSRQNQVGDTGLDEIQDYINAKNSAGEIVSQSSLGQELRAENNSAFIVGGQKQQLYEQVDTSYIVPFWGYDANGNLISSTWALNGDPQWYVYIPYYDINNALNTPIVVPVTAPDPESLLCAALGDFESFLMWLFTYGQGTVPHSYMVTQLGFPASAFIVDPAVGTIANLPPVKPFDGNWGDPSSIAFRDAQTLYDFIHNYATEYYGKKFIVGVPWVCFDLDSDTNRYIWSDEPATDGGWVDGNGTTTSIPIGGEAESDYILGIQHRTAETDFFSDDVGKTQCFVRFYGINDFSHLNTEDYIAGTSLQDSIPSVWVKADLDDKWTPYSFAGTTKAGVVVSLGDQVNIFRSGVSGIADEFNVHYGWNMRTGILPTNIGTNIANSPDRSDIVAAAMNPFVSPFAVLVPVKSNTQTYGPWYGQAGTTQGNVYFEKDPGLVPWEYGSSSFMGLAALSRIDNSITAMQKGERGSVTIAGYPDRLMGTALTDSQVRVDDRALSTKSYGSFQYYYINTGGTSLKASQITSIQVNINGSAINTKYELSTFTPVFGRFTKNNADRLKQIGQQSFQISKSLRAMSAQANRKIAERASIRRRVARNIAQTSFAHRSSAMYLTGRYYPTPSGEVKRKSVVGQTMGMAAIYDNYDDSSLMSLDGMFRPVMKRTGTGSGIPVENAAGSPSHAIQPTFSESPAGPVDDYTTPIINIDYLDFLANPGSVLSARGSGNPGHDIEAVARGTLDNLTGTAGNYINIQDGSYNYDTGYRYISHRGPMFMHGWGYDIMGKPIPNANETGVYSGSMGSPTSGSPYSGNHRQDYHLLTDQFHSGWLEDPTTWPVGPIDLRWDRRRSVWTIPTDFRLYLADIQTVLAVSGTANAFIRNADDVYDDSGTHPTGADGKAVWDVTVTNPYLDDIPPQRTLIYYSHESGQWWPLGYCCTGDVSSPPGGPSGDDTPPCARCEGECYWRCVAGTWVLQTSSRCYNVDTNDDTDCGCDEPNYVCEGTSDLLVATKCIHSNCGPGGTSDGDSGGGTGPIVYMNSNKTFANKVEATIIQDMPCDATFTYGQAISPQYIIYTGSYANLTGTGGLFLTSCLTDSGVNDPNCELEAIALSGAQTPLIGNINDDCLPSGTTVSLEYNPATNSYYITRYKLPGNGCSSISGDADLYYYNRVLANASGGQMILTLPSVTGDNIPGTEYTVKKIDTTANYVIVSGSGTDTIDGQTTYILTNQNESATFVACGSSWWVV